jgi:16S rRNA (cytosine967-C5)-methyltransferase
VSAPTPARRVAYEVLRRVFEHDAYADRALRSAADRHGVEGRERALAQRLAYGSVQRRGTSDHLIMRFANRPIDRIDPPLLAALRLGIFELLFEGGVRGYAAVDQSVELAKGGRDGGRRHRGAGLVNAILRRVAADGPALLEGLAEDSPEAAAVRHSVPRWIAELWWRQLGRERALALMAATNRPPQRVYRATGGHEGCGELLRRLAAAGVQAGSIEADDRWPQPALIGVAGGEWGTVADAVGAGELLPQSLGSALAAALVEAEAGERLLDVCAAPGIKATQLASAVGPVGSVVAVDRDEGRAGELGQLCGRVGVRNVRVEVGDARELDLGSGYDRVLVDAPCSGLGTLASRPDARWRRSAAAIDELARLQSQLLDVAAAALRPGGRLLYSVCTISRAEGRDVAAAALRRHDDLEPLDLGERLPELAAPEDGRFLQLLPDRDRTDGFFVAALERRR